MNPVILSAVIAGVVSAVLSGLSAYLAVKIALTKLEYWQTRVADPLLDKLVSDVSAHQDDLRTHDVEIGMVMSHAKLERVRRQTLR
jgi:hypothetical protein